MVMLSGLQTSLSGMKVAQNQMDIVGRNLANIDTVGYTRKKPRLRKSRSGRIQRHGCSAGRYYPHR